MESIRHLNMATLERAWADRRGQLVLLVLHGRPSFQGVKTVKRLPKKTAVQEYLEEPVLFGGLPMSRAEMIRELERLAAGLPNPQACTNQYLAGHTSRHELERSRGN